MEYCPFGEKIKLHYGKPAQLPPATIREAAVRIPSAGGLSSGLSKPATAELESAATVATKMYVTARGN